MDFGFAINHSGITCPANWYSNLQPLLNRMELKVPKIMEIVNWIYLRCKSVNDSTYNNTCSGFISF